MLDTWNYTEQCRHLVNQPGVIALFLDFDGTLAPLVATPDKAQLPSQTRQVLNALAGNDRVRMYIISGRGLKDLRSKIDIEGNVMYSGSHGLEWEHEGQRGWMSVPPELLTHLQAIRTQMQELAEMHKGALVEDKKFSIAFHYRQVADADKPAVEATLKKHLQQWQQMDGLEVYSDKHTFDVHADVAWDKGAIVDQFLAMLDETVSEIIYLGDSETDESAFKAFPDATTIKVGEFEETAARYHLRNTTEVYEFLKQLDVCLQQKG